MKEKDVGTVSTYFSKVGVAAIKLTDNLNSGDKIHVKGNTTNFMDTVMEIQIDKDSVSEAKKGDHIGIKVPDRVRPGDSVFVVQNE